MIVELGNHAPVADGIDDRPKITTIHIPEADDQGLGGYTHAPGLAVADFKAHLAESLLRGPARRGVTQLPAHEILTPLAHPEGTRTADGENRPAWVKVTPHKLTPDGRAADIEAFLSEFYECPPADAFFGVGGEEQLVRK